MSAIVVYTGPSMLDDSPIVVLATLGSTNIKTGPMVQTWIMCADITPVAASKASADVSICGTCPRRHSLGGDCYVLVHNAPQSAWRAWERSGKPEGDPEAAAYSVARTAAGNGVRLGAYGDPAAVPHTVWERFLGHIGVINGRMPEHTGYTHQWRATMFPTARDAYAHTAWCKRNLMASVDSPREADLARASGWRFFLAVPPSLASAIPTRTIECLSVRPGSTVTCQDCGICDGSQGRASRASVYLVEHGARSGAKSKRSAALSVLA